MGFASRSDPSYKGTRPSIEKGCRTNAAKALGFSEQQAFTALQPSFASGLGTALMSAGYSLSSLVVSFLNLNLIGTDSAAVAAAFPGLFGNAGALVAESTAASNLQAMGVSGVEAGNLLIAVHSAAAQQGWRPHWTRRASAPTTRPTLCWPT